MINLRSNSILARWFVWCCDHLPATVTRDYSVNKQNGVRRSGSHYIKTGTTLCHIFWAILWVPLLVCAAAAFGLSVFVYMHVDLYHKYSKNLGIAAAFIPEGFVFAFVATIALLSFSIIGASNVGLLKLIWLYLTSLKSRVCPLVSFEAAKGGEGE